MTSLTFAAKLCAFFLNDPAIKDIKWTSTGGFTQPSVTGVLPFLHMNITRDAYIKILNSTFDQLNSTTLSACNESKLDKTLESLGFFCKDQSDNATKTLIKRMIDTIDSGYHERSHGKEMTKQMATRMIWQSRNSNDGGKSRIIPAESVLWCTGVFGLTLDERIVNLERDMVVSKAGGGRRRSRN
jgi:hypothetical protein